MVDSGLRPGVHPEELEPGQDRHDAAPKAALQQPPELAEEAPEAGGSRQRRGGLPGGAGPVGGGHCGGCRGDGAKTGRQGSGVFYDRLADEGCDAESLLEERQYRHVQNRELRRALDQLEERERFILVARHLQEDAVTLRELGDRLGISKERVRQLENRALESLRSCMAQAHKENGALAL
ncbi:MAG: sigma-70 family RNA polymerase sigma factor [Deltaproteobacteria bacterium]|nr:sigma-70 family RNA polymerase sigma factor [Deltaproteobacteria bacterium]